MPRVIFFEYDGTRHEVDATNGVSLMRAAVDHSVPGIDADCGGACACATCHVYVDEGWVEKTGKASQMEEDMLDFAFDVKPNSRLCCQITVRPELDGLSVTTPAQQG